MMKTRILSFLLAMIMVLLLLPVSVFAADSTESETTEATQTTEATEGTHEVVSQQLSLGDDLTMLFYVAAEANTVVNVTVNGETSEHDLSAMDPDSNGQYVIAVELAAAQMTEEITLDFLQNDVSVLQKTYSIRDYAVSILENNYPARTKGLVRQMLNYGAAAQNYFGVNTDRLANDGYETEEVQLPEQYEAMAISGEIEGIRFYGASLVFESKIAVRYYFVADSAEGVTFTANGEAYQAAQKNGLYYVEIPGINPQDYDKSIALTATKGEESLTVSYSPLNYIIRMSEKGSNELKALVNALYGYHTAATEYVKNAAQEGTFFGTAESFVSSNAIDLSTDCGEAPYLVLDAHKSTPLYVYIADLNTQNFSFETTVKVNSVIENENYPKLGMLVNGQTEMVKFYLDMNTDLQVSQVGAVHQNTGKDDDWAYQSINTLSETLELGAETVTLKLVRDGINYYFYVNGAMALAGSDLTDENGAAGFFSFGTELTLTDYTVVAEDAAYEEILAQAKADAETFNQQRNQILQESSSYTVETLELGATTWSGRGFVFTELPEELVGQSYVFGKINTQIDMTVLQNGYLYVMTPPTTHANFPDNILAEGSGFTQLNIATDWCMANYTNPIDTLVFEREVKPGESVTIDASWAIVVVSKDRLNLYPLLMPNDSTTVKTVAIGEKIWSDDSMAYTFISMPEQLIGQEYLYGSINEGVDVTAGKDGYFYVITHPRTDSHFAADVDNYDFERLELPQWTFADYSSKRNTWVYELKVSRGERIQLGAWWGVLIGSETQLDLTDNGITVPNSELAVISSDTYAAAPVELNQQVFSDQSSYYYHTIPYWMAGKSFLCAPLNGGEATVTKAGKLYLLGRNEANGKKYLDLGFTHVMDLDFEPWGGTGYGGGNFTALGFALYEKDVTVGETVTWGRWGVPLFYSDKTLPVEPVDGVIDIEITQMPVKTTYQLGESFDDTGLVVTGIDANGNKVALSRQDYLLAPTVLSSDVPAVSVIVNDQICAIPVTVTDENGNDLTDYTPSDVSGFTTQKAPIVTGSISLSTVDDIVTTIQKEEADGATGFIVYLTTLSESERTVENLKRIADCTQYPVMALAYGTYENLEMRLNLWRMAVEAGFDAVDIPADTYSVSYDACKTSYAGTAFEIPAPKEVSMDADVIAQQQAFMAELREINPNVEILMSAHVGVAMNQAQGVALAKEMESRGADIAKIVLASTSNLEEALQTNMVLQQELNIPFFYNCAGAASRPYRTAAGLMGTQVVFCCAPYHQINSYVYDNARDLREFYNTIPELYQEIQSEPVEEPEGVSLSTNYFTETEDGVYTLTTNSSAEYMVDDVLYDGAVLKAPYYSVKGTISLANANDWGQARILVSADAENEYFIALENISGSFQIFTMSKAGESSWNDWRLIEHCEVNGSRNALDFEVIVNGSQVAFLIDDKICYESQRVTMTESTVKFTGYNVGTTTVENLEVQVFETGDAVGSYLETKSQAEYVSRFQTRMDSLYQEYITENACAGKGGTLIFGDSNMDFWSTWETQTGLTKYVDGYNVGIGGSTTLDWLHAYDQLIAPFEADRFVILVGGNDVNVWGDDGEVVVQRLQTLFEKLHADHPYAEIYYIYTTPSPSAYSGGVYTPAKLGALVSGAKALCEGLDYVQGIDVFDLMVTDDKLSSNTALFSDDLVHMNEDGYAVFSAYLYEQIFKEETAFFGQTGSYKTGEQFDLSKDTGANSGTVTVSENGIALGYVDDFHAEDFYFEAKLHIDGVAETESYPKFGMFLQNDVQCRSFYVDMTTDLTSGVVGVVTSVGDSYDWANTKTAPVADMAFSGDGETVTMGILKQGRRVHLFINGSYVMSSVWDFSGDAVTGIFSFNTGMTVTEYFTSVSQNDLDAKAAFIPESELNKGDLFGYAVGDGVTYTTSDGIDLSGDTGDDRTIRIYGGAPQYTYLNDVFTDRFCFETKINVESVLNDDGYPKFGLTVNGSSEMVKFFVDMTPAMTAAYVGVVYQPTGGGDDWAGSKSCEVTGMSFTGSDTVKLKLVRDGRAYFFYVNDVLVMYDDAGFKAEKGAVGIFSFNTVLTASNYSVSVGVAADSAVADATSLGLTGNYFTNDNGVYTLTTDSDAQHLVDDLTRGGYTLREDIYCVSGTLTLTDAQDWGQARILISADAQNEHFIALEKLPTGNYQIFSMSKAAQDAWDVWQLIADENENGTRNSIDFEVVVIGNTVYFLIDGTIAYTSNRVSMTQSNVKFTGCNVGTTTVENLSVQVFENQEAAESYLENKILITEPTALLYKNELQTVGADPSVICISEGEDAGYYYMYVTSDGLDTKGFLAYRSTDLVEWECVGTALSAYEQYDEATGNTTVSYLSADYWAPEVIYDADTGLYYMFYSATRQENEVTRFYADIAVSDSPAGPFIPYNKYLGKEPVVIDEENKILAYEPMFDFANMDPEDPLYETNTDGYMKVIDMSPFVDPVSGKKYVYFCHDHAAELEITKSGIYVMALNDDYTPDYSEIYALTEADSTLGEGQVNEAPYMVYNEQSGKYYLLYSANAYYQQSYCVRVAVGDSPVGPFQKLSQDEGGYLLYADSDWTWAAGTGHCTVISKDGQDYIVYHAHKEQTEETLIRGIAMDELHWVENADGLLVPVANGPSVTAMPLTTYTYENIASLATVTADHVAEGSTEALTDGLILHHDSSFLQDVVFDGSSATITLQFDEAKTISAVAVYNSSENLFSNIESIRLQLVGGGYISYNELAFNMDQYKTEDGTVIPGGSVAVELLPIEVIAIEIVMPASDAQYAVSEIAVIAER